MQISITSRDLRCSDRNVQAILFGSEDEMHLSHDEGIVIVQLGPGMCIACWFGTGHRVMFVIFL
jgi:hypothetical protein